MYRARRILLAVVLIVASAEGNDNPFRLPTSTKPAHYKVILKIDPDQPKSFSGRVSINLFAQTSTDTIVLHSNVAAIENITVKEGPDDLYSSHNVTSDETNFLKVQLTKNLTLNQLYVLEISYIGKYGDSVDGLYLSTYMGVDGTNKKLAVTQMAPADARKVFPCYDEPSFKSTFQINVYAPEGYQVISNEDVTVETQLPEIEDGLLLTTFKETPPMSTYLIALLVSNYTYKSNLEQGDQIFGKKYRVFARAGVEHEMDFALRFGQMAMTALENYTTVEYVFSKLDNAALPNLYYNAMENWGLIIYREPRLLYNENTTKTKDLQGTAIVIAHESAHMWFGNHVTPKWWDFVWLSEGFATYFESFITNKIAPEWRLMDQFTINNNHRAMKFDSTNSTNSMTNPLGPPQELVNNFNLIAYQKAASVIRMIQHVMGEPDFHAGIVNYLTSIPMGNSEPSILFDGFQKAIEGKETLPQNVSMADVFSSWSDQKGYPVIKVSRTNGNFGIHLTQQRYHDDETVTTPEKYWIPINWATSNNVTFEDTNTQIWFDPKIDILELSLNLNENEWFILNKQQTGYYRVMYDITTWNLISEALKSEDFRDIHFLNRAQLIDDSMNFAQTLRISYNVTLNLLSYLQKELDFVPWSSAYNGLKFLDNLMPAAENFDKYLKFIVNITKQAFESLGLDEDEKDDPITKMNRITIGELACKAGSAECRNRAHDKLLSIINNNASSLQVNLKELIYCAGIRDANESIWDYFWLEYLNGSQSSDKDLIIKGLACSESRPIIHRYLQMAVSTNVDINDLDRTAIVQSVINSGPTGIDIVVDFLNTDFTSLQSTTQTVAIITNLANKVVTKENVNKFKEFAANPNLTPDERRATDSAIKTIKQNADWLEMTLIDIDPWLSDYL